MKFDSNWTKEDNDQYRSLIKEHKSIKEIISIMGLEKLKYKPNGSFSYGGVLKNFGDFLTEIKYTEKWTEISLSIHKSKYFNGDNYEFYFKTENENEYVFEFVYYMEKVGPFIGSNLYNLSFTTKRQKELSDKIKDDKIRTNVYEEITDLKETHEIFKRLIYLFKHFHIYYGKRQKAIYVIGETSNPQKINYYKDSIKSSFDDVIETKGESSINLGDPVYYYQIID